MMRFKKPNKIPEANVQAEIYRLLRNKNIKVCLEYRMECESQGRHIRADIAVIHEGNIICLIECKSRKGSKGVNKQTRQYKAYKSIGVDFIYCLNWHEIKDAVNYVVDKISKQTEQHNRR